MRHGIYDAVRRAAEYARKRGDPAPQARQGPLRASGGGLGNVFEAAIAEARRVHEAEGSPIRDVEGIPPAAVKAAANIREAMSRRYGTPRRSIPALRTETPATGMVRTLEGMVREARSREGQAIHEAQTRRTSVRLPDLTADQMQKAKSAAAAETAAFFASQGFEMADGQWRCLPDTRAGDVLREDTSAAFADCPGLLEATAAGPGTSLLRNVVLIRAGLTQNGRYYSPTVLQAAMSHYNRGLPMYHSHGTESERQGRTERLISDWCANVVAGSARWDAQKGAIVADVQLIEGNQHGKQIMAMIADSHVRSRIGLSHAVAADRKMGDVEGKRVEVVTSINHVSSVDWVMGASAGGGLQ